MEFGVPRYPERSRLKHRRYTSTCWCPSEYYIFRQHTSAAPACCSSFLASFHWSTTSARMFFQRMFDFEEQTQYLLALWWCETRPRHRDGKRAGAYLLFLPYLIAKGAVSNQTQGFVVRQLITPGHLPEETVKRPNVLLPCGNFPDKWTVASAVPLLKVNDPYNTGNYRSISIADSLTNF